VADQVLEAQAVADKMKPISFFILTFLIGSLAMAQTEHDALRFSQSEVTGTARYIGLGGAFTALGGDATGALHNPAGIAVLRNNEFSISASYRENSSTGIYNGQQTLSGSRNFSIPSFHLAGVKDLPTLGKWRSSAISIGSNQIFDFHEYYSVNGSDIPDSKLDYYTAFLNKNNVDYRGFDQSTPIYPFDLYLAWFQYLVDTIPGNSSEFYNSSGVMPVNQSFNVERLGSKKQNYVNFGFNYDDKFYIGAGAALSSVSFERTETYSEFIDQSDSTTWLRNFSETTYETITGSGIKLNVGIIYRPINSLRLGLSLNSPEWLNLKSTYETQTTATFQGIAESSTASPIISRYKFSVGTAPKATIGAAYIIKKLGLISADIDYINYQMISMRGRTDGDPFTAENKAINSYLNSSVNARIGLEARITPVAYARAGYAYYGNPYKSEINGKDGFTVASLGGGYRSENYFVDASIQGRMSEDAFYLYPSNNIEKVQVNSFNTRITITFGMRF